MAWTLTYKHNFSARIYYIWNNRDILYKHKSLFSNVWFENNTFFVSQLMNSHGVLLSYTELLDKFKIPIRSREYAILLDAIPSKVLCLLKNDCNENPNLDYINNSILIGNINILKNNTSNKYIRNLVNYFTYPAARYFLVINTWRLKLV